MKKFFLYLGLLLVALLVCYTLAEKSGVPKEKKTTGPPSGSNGEAVVAEGKIIIETSKTPAGNDGSKAAPIPEVAKPDLSTDKPKPNYYPNLTNLDGAELKAALHRLIRRHRVLTYGELWDALIDLDQATDGQVMLVYKRIPRAANKHGGDHGEWNREHLWPRAYGISRSSPANTDLHHIRASDVKTNADRGHLYFDESEGETGAGLTFSSDHDSWEPPREVKGDIARAMFYMAVRYEGGEIQEADLELGDTADMSKRQLGKLSVLLEWHRLDPVSAEEKARNEKVFRHYQGNRNPFIDHPELARRVFVSMP